MVVLDLGGDDGKLPDTAAYAEEDMRSKLGEVIALVNAHHEQLLGNLSRLAEHQGGSPAQNCTSVASSALATPRKSREAPSQQAPVDSSSTPRISLKDNGALFSEASEHEDVSNFNARSTVVSNPDSVWSCPSLQEGLAQKRCGRADVSLYMAQYPANKEAAMQKGLEAIMPEGTHTTCSEFRPQGWVHRVSESVAFELFFGSVIIASAVFTGVEMEYQSHHTGEPTPLVFEVLQHICAIAFSVELAIRIYANGFQKFYRKDWHWAVMDTAIVCVGMFDFVLDIAMRVSENGWAQDNSILGIVRFTRLVRAFRLNRLIRFISPLRILVDSIIVTLRSLVWALVLLGIIIYVFALTFTQSMAFHLPQEDDPNKRAIAREYWGSLGSSMVTLFQTITGGDDWRNSLEPLADASPFMAVLLIIYVAFTCFAVLNVVTGFFCNSAIKAAERNPELVHQSMCKDQQLDQERILALLKAIGMDGKTRLTIQGIEAMLRHPKFHVMLSAMGIDVADAWDLYKLVDDEQSGTIEVDAFLGGVCRLKGHARATELAGMRYDLRSLAKRLASFMQSMEDQFIQTGSPDPSKVLGA